MERKTIAIGVVLSGADSDGALGLQAIRGEGGIAIVQSENSTKHPGIGFDHSRVHHMGGLGLIGIQERVRLVRGEFSLETQPGRGTAIMIRVPLN